MDDAEDREVTFETTQNKFGRTIQKMFFLDENGQHTRDYFFSEEQALEQLQERFDFRSGQTYVISYLTNYQWRSGQAFNFIRRRTNLANHVYSTETEVENYGDQALDEGDLHIYGIVVQQMSN